jgi:hypothetical protein
VGHRDNLFQALDAFTGSFGSHLKKLLSFYLLLFLALAHEAIPAIAPPELIDRMTYVNKPAQLTTRGCVKIWRSLFLRNML